LPIKLPQLIRFSHHDSIALQLNPKRPNISNLAFAQEKFDQYNLVSRMVKISTIFLEVALPNPFAISMAMSLGFYFLIGRTNLKS